MIASLNDLKERLEGLDTTLAEEAKLREDDRALLERVDANVMVIKKLGIENKAELRRTREVLMKGLFEATEVSTPTTFIVLNEELPPPPTEEEKKKLEMLATEDGSG